MRQHRVPEEEKEHKHAYDHGTGLQHEHEELLGHHVMQRLGAAAATRARATFTAS